MPLYLFYSLNPLFFFFFFKLCYICMEPCNLTGDTEFFLLELLDGPELQPLLVSMFLSMYLVTAQEPIHHSGCHLWLPLPHPYVLLPFQLVLGWHQFQHNYSSQDTDEPADIQKIHRLCRLPNSGYLSSLFSCLDSLLLALMTYD